jgi:hypothetical protein
VRIPLCELKETGPLFAQIDILHPRSSILLVAGPPGAAQRRLGNIWKDSHNVLHATIPGGLSGHPVKDLMRIFVEIFNDSPQTEKLIIAAPWDRREIFLNNGFRRPWFSRVFVRDRSSLPPVLKHRLTLQNALTF